MNDVVSEWPYVCLSCIGIIYYLQHLPPAEAPEVQSADSPVERVMTNEMSPLWQYVALEEYAGQ